LHHRQTLDGTPDQRIPPYRPSSGWAPSGKSVRLDFRKACVDRAQDKHRWETDVVRFDVGHRLLVGGGYDLEPQCLGGQANVRGVVLKRIPGQNAEPACVVLLNEPLTAEGLVGTRREVVTGSHLVLELRYEGQSWERSGTVHVELCPSEPPSLKWGDRSPGARVESHATYTFED
jgi:hypothetical protein